MNPARDNLRKSIDLLDDKAVGLINELVERLLISTDFDYTFSTVQEEEETRLGWEDLGNGDHVSLDDFLQINL